MTDDEVLQWLSEEERSNFKDIRQWDRPCDLGVYRSLAETRRALAPLPDILDQRFITGSVNEDANVAIAAAVAFFATMPRPR